MLEELAWPGNAGPADLAPALRPGTVRRTVTIDGDRPDGPHGDVVLVGRGRDLGVDASGQLAVLADQHLRARADFVGGQEIRELSADPAADALDALVGVGSRSGFRQAVADAIPERHGDGSLLSLLLDEIPIVTSLSRLALLQSGAIDITPGSSDPANRRRAAPIVCAGWAPGSAMTRQRELGLSSLLTAGIPVDAPEPRSAGGWHYAPPLSPAQFRRRRLIEVRLESDGSALRVESAFRDSYLATDGRERAIHEYSVDATLDVDTLRFTSCTARDNVLPGPECRLAAASAGRIVDVHARDVLDFVRRELSGLDTCTHLNDHLRALADVHALVPPLARSTDLGPTRP